MRSLLRVASLPENRSLQERSRERGYSSVETTLEIDMDKDRIAGAAKQAKGAVKDATGKVVGDRDLQVDGKMDKAEGKVQKEVGKAKDAVRDAVKR